MERCRTVLVYLLLFSCATTQAKQQVDKAHTPALPASISHKVDELFADWNSPDAPGGR
jgi:hypothetical protein